MDEGGEEAVRARGGPEAAGDEEEANEGDVGDIDDAFEGTAAAEDEGEGSPAAAGLLRGEGAAAPAAETAAKTAERMVDRERERESERTREDGSLFSKVKISGRIKKTPDDGRGFFFFFAKLFSLFLSLWKRKTG